MKASSQEAAASARAPEVERLLAHLAQAHRTPRRVEQFGVEVVPQALRTATWADVFVIWFTTVLNPVFFMVPGMAVVSGGLSYWQAVAMMCAGALIAFAGNSALATFGPDYGLPGQMLARSIFGIVGTKLLISVLRMLTGCYWFAFQTLAAALGIQSVLGVLTGRTFDLLAISLALALLQTTFALFGFGVMKQAGRIVLPLMLFVAGTMLFLFLTASDPAYALERVLWQPPRSSGWAAFAVWLSIMIGTWTPIYASAADFCRYGRSRRQMWLGTALGAPAGLLVAAAVGAYAASASGDWNPFAVAARVAGSGPALFILIFGLMLSVLLANTMNLYVAGMSLVNILPRMGRFWATAATAVIAVGLSLLPTIIHDAQGWMGELGHIFTPIAGVLLADYLVLKRSHVDVGALFRSGGRYRYWREVNWVGLGTIVLGYLLYGLFPAALVPAAATVVASGGIYLVAMAAARKWTAYREAAQPAEGDEAEE